MSVAVPLSVIPSLAPSIAVETPIARMERIAKGDLPVLPSPPIDTPESPEKRREDIDRWKALAQGYASLCIRQREFEDAILAEAKRNDVRLARIETLLESIIVESTIDPATVSPPPRAFDEEAPTCSNAGGG